ncbi:DUF952 domain-containing protein [Rhizohabitans arisaemae]|uniref:DUF952 domain-containing protein n=1 Tax=Rhizohabitans arisaemae TaxID=2720610 RepID=UPI0024B04881|nr:DUF952 domain-containing protein [Rhizohabitans arisaemae]
MAERMIYHLALERDWESARQAGEYSVSTLGRTLEQVGFVHASADPQQLLRVANTFYRGVAEPLVVLTIAVGLLGHPVADEVPADSDEAFPHVYGPIPVAAVTAVTPLPMNPEGGFTDFRTG